jgi:hypothetical protein
MRRDRLGARLLLIDPLIDTRELEAKGAADPAVWKTALAKSTNGLDAREAQVTPNVLRADPALGSAGQGLASEVARRRFHAVIVRPSRMETRAPKRSTVLQGG